MLVFGWRLTHGLAVAGARHVLYGDYVNLS